MNTTRETHMHDNTLLLIAWRVVTAFEDRGYLTAADVEALRELATTTTRKENNADDRYGTRPIDAGTQPLCLDCGALVGSTVAHDIWHARLNAGLQA